MMMKTRIRLSEQMLLSRIAIPDAHARIETIGVKTPMNINVEMTKTKADTPRGEEAPNSWIRLMGKIAATEKRKSSKAIPGAPCGNIENSRCTLVP